MRRGAGERGFTTTDAVVIVVAIVAVAALIAILMPAWSNGRPSRQLKDATQIRGIVQAMTVLCQGNLGLGTYSLPSRLDRDGATVAGEAAAKNTSAHIMSILVYNGFVPVEMLVSPLETNPNIVPFEGYQFDKPSTAVNPEQATWDPGFNVDFTGSKKGALSYAHLQPVGERRSRWADNFEPTEAVVSMRGPEIRSVVTQPDRSVVPQFANPKSRTFGMFDRDRSSWSGNVGFTDNHVDYLSKALSPGKAVPFSSDGGVYGGKLYKDSAGTERVDLMFFDEPDDPVAANDYLGIFITAGERPWGFQAIWD